MNGKGLSKNIIIGIVVLVVIGAAIAILGFTSPGGPPGPPPTEEEKKEEVADAVIENAGDVDPKLIRLDVRNTGTATITIKRITVKDTDIEGFGLVNKKIGPGEIAQDLDVSLSKGELKTGANPLKFTIETDKGNFEVEYTITVD